MHAQDISITLLLVLGAAHGVNPAMGWLFAVSLGLQEQRRAAVWGALGPLALGHALAVAAAVGVAVVLGLVVPVGVLKVVTAVALGAFGLFHLTRHRHPRWGGMRVGARDLTIWSFLMASAHGAGLMVVPLVLGASAVQTEHAAHEHAGHLLAAGFSGIDSAAITATFVHTAGYLLVTGILAVIVYEKLGLRLLRTAWINLNAIWATALILTAAITLLA